MTSVITGDIIRSSQVKTSLWMEVLKKVLSQIGPTPQRWEIYRGDSFQAEVENPLDALEFCIKIKANIKTIKGIDVRLAIGIGEKSFEAQNITQCNGTAFINSGHKFDQLNKEKINMGIKSPWENFDKEMNLLLRLALISMDNWTSNGSQMVALALVNKNYSQEELGKLIGIKQNTVSTRLKRSYYNEILELIEFYKEKLKVFL